MTGVALAANYSRALVCLLACEPDLVDAVKVSEFDGSEYVQGYDVLARRRPLILHGLACAARPGDPDFDGAFEADRLRRAVQLTGAKWVSAHLEFFRRGGAGLDASGFIEKLAVDVNRIRQVSGLPVLLENTHFYRSHASPGSNDPTTCDPDFIGSVLVATGCEMLLDVAHAQVAAWSRGERAYDYLRRLPLARVREIHVSGPTMVNGELRDRHHETTEEGYHLLGLALAAARAEVVTLEYGGVGPVFEARSDPEALRRQLVRLRALLMEAGT